MTFIEYDSDNGDMLCFAQCVIVSAMLTSKNKYNHKGMFSVLYTFDDDKKSMDIKFKFIDKNNDIVKMALHVAFKGITNLSNSDKVVSLRDAGLSYPYDEYVMIPANELAKMHPNLIPYIAHIVNECDKRGLAESFVYHGSKDYLKEMIRNNEIFDTSEVSDIIKIKVYRDDDEVVIKHEMPDRVVMTKRLAFNEFEKMSESEFEQFVADFVSIGVNSDIMAQINKLFE